MKEKKNDLILVDTGVLLKFLLGEEGKETIRELLIKIVSGEVRGFYQCGYPIGTCNNLYPQKEGISDPNNSGIHSPELYNC